MNDTKDSYSWLATFKSVLFLLGDKKASYIFWSVLRFLTFFYVIIPPLIVGLTVDFFTNYQAGDSLMRFYVYSVVLGISSVVFLITRSTTKRYLLYIHNRVLLNVNVKGFEKLISFSLKKHDSENTGAKAQRISNGATSYRLFLRMLENRIYPSLATFVGTVLVFIFLSPIYIVFFVVYLILFFFLLKIFYKKIQNNNYQHNLAREKASGVYVEGLSNVLSIKSAGAEKNFKDHINTNEEKSKEYGDKVVKIVMNQWTSFHILNSVAMGLFLFLIGRGIIFGTISIGAVVIVFSYFDKLLTASTDMLSIYQELIETKTGIARLMLIFDDELEGSRGHKAFPVQWHEIKLKDLSFTYKHEDKDEFHTGVYDVNLEISKNEKIGLAGKTGSGKSTLAKLLVGLYKIDQGVYKYDDVNYYDIDTESASKNISIVLQESEMFSFSLRDNITLMHEFNENLFNKVIKIAQLEEVIKKMPEGINTFIGEKGYHLSGGERQRVGIARAIYRDADIIIFDEATSSLDSTTEELIQQSLERELEKKTLIFIAHRITTLKNVDRIYVFKNGRIVEQGVYDELLNNSKSEFFRIFSQKKEK